MKYKLTTPVFILLICLSCNKESERIEKEDFNEFFKQYLSDQEFQEERTIFPVIFTQNNDDNIEYIARKITRKEWKPLRDKIDKTKYSRHFEIKENISIVKTIGKETGIHIQYRFKMKDNKWYLYQISDLRMSSDNYISLPTTVIIPYRW